MRAKFIPLTFSIFLSFFAIAQDEKQPEGKQESADDLAQKLSNPTAAVGSLTLNLDYISYGGDLPDASGQSSFNLLFQPSLPKPLNIGFNLLFRPAIPINVQQPYFNGIEFENSGFGLGNIGFDLALGKTNEKGLLYLFGMVGFIPTASQKEVRGQWAFGPEFLIGIVKKKFVGGLLLTQQWDVESGPRSTNILGGQYFYAIPIGKGQNIASGPASSWARLLFALK